MTIPEQIRRQSEAVEKFYKEKETQTDSVEAKADETAPEGSETVEVQKADSGENTATAPTPNEQRQVGNKENEETYEKRYKTLQGMYNADTARLRAENQQMNQRLTQMEQLLSTLSTTPAKQTANVEKLVTDKDVEEYGDSIEVMRKVTKEEVSAANQRIADLEHMIRQMQASVLPRVEQVAQKQALSSEQLFWTELSAAVPNWREINADENFLNWLTSVDPLTGMTRQTYLEDAQRSFDTRRVANFFSTWQDLNGQQVAQSPRNATASELDRQVAPGRSRGSGAPAQNTAKIYAPKDIQKFFDDVRKGVYQGKETERDRIERDIFAAQRENRIVATG